MKKFATKKRIAGILAIILAFVLAFNLPQYFDSETKAASGTSTTYGLKDNIQDGVILHAWNWSYDTIKANLADIAAAGYTTVQTSPVQQPKDYGASYLDVSGQWWKLYQPVSFSVAKNSWLGNASQLKSLCETADQYGIKIICDIVVNHLGNQTDGHNLNAAVATYESEIYNNQGRYFHSYTDCNDGSIQNVVWGNIGMPDLNTSDTYVQNRVISLLKECIDCGVDGFRFDAAKHIETPDDGSYASNFWPNVIGTATSYAKSSKNIDLYCYGEILNTPGSGRSFSSYTKYMSIIDNKTSDNCTANIKWNNAANAVSSYYYTGQSANKLVLWAESHDTYMGESGSAGISNTSGISVDIINKSWAIVASRAGASALYFVRPGSAKMGNMGTTNWKSAEVVAVNKFHNEFAGALEYNSSTGSIAVVERYFTTGSGNCGAVLVNVGGSNTVSNVTANKLSDGTYKDHVSGNTFTVSGGKINGQMSNVGIAVIYNESIPDPVNTINPAGATFTDTVSVTVGLSNATSGTYKIGNGSQVTYTTSTTFSLGSDMNYGESVTVYLTATNGSKTTSASYVFNKIDPSSQTTMYFDPSPCTWFGNSNAVPVVKFDSGSYQTMSTVTYQGKTYYSILIPVGAEKVTVARQVPSGLIYNEYTTNLVSGKTLLVANSDWNSGGTWTTAPDPGEFETTTEPETSTAPILETRTIYFDASACSWFGTDSAVAVISVDESNFEEMSVVTVNGKSYYSKEISNTATSITIARKIANGNMYNEKTFTLNDNNLLTAYSDWNNGGSWSELQVEIPTDPETTTSPVAETMRIYFSNNKSWSNIYVYYWGSSASTTTWPGVQMTYLETNQYNESIYFIDIPKDVTGIIFTDNAGSQTVDITSGIQDGLGYYISGGSGSALTVGTYTYGD